MSNPLDNCNESDLRRFAACWLNSDLKTTDWEKAAAQYDATVKVQSFRTVSSRAAAKVLKGTDSESAEATPKKGGAKRKAASAEDSEASPPKKRGRAKKTKSEEPVSEDADDGGDDAAPVVKDEEEDELLG